MDKKRPRTSYKVKFRKKEKRELFSVYTQSEAPLRKVDDGVKKTLDNYLEDLILLGKE